MPRIAKEPKVKEPKVKEPKVKEPKPPKEPKVKEPKPAKEPKVKEPKPAKKTKEPKAPKDEPTIPQSFLPLQRPLIVQLPVHSSELDQNLFETQETSAFDLNPFDTSDQFMMFNQSAEELSLPEQKTREVLPFPHCEKLMVRFQDANMTQTLPSSTTTACFWDCHPFKGTPYVIPAAIEEDIWCVYGNFCCPQCAAAYLFHEKIDNHTQWERFALLNRLYTDESSEIQLAPSRLILHMFGGPLDIVDYRALLGEKKLRVDVMTPPIISIIQVMDTKPIDYFGSTIKSTLIPWELDRVNRPGAQGLRLRRTKPLVNNWATLENCMGVEVKTN